MSNEDNIDEAVQEILRRVDANGAATMSVKDGHIIALSLQKLKTLIAEVEAAQRDFCVIFVMNPKSLN